MDKVKVSRAEEPQRGNCMTKDEIKAKFEAIYKKYRENYDGDYFMYDCVNRDMLLSLCYAYDDGEISEAEYYAMSNYVLNEMLKKLAEDYKPLKGSEDGKFKWKVSSMSANQLRIEIEDKLSQIEDIEQYYDNNELSKDEEESLVKQYRLLALSMSLASRELFTRTFTLKEIDII